MDWVQIMKNKPTAIVLLIGTLVFGGSKLTISSDEATVDSLNIEIIKAQKDILVLERDLKSSLVLGADERRAIRDDMKDLKKTINAIHLFLMNRKPLVVP